VRRARRSLSVLLRTAVAGLFTLSLLGGFTAAAQAQVPGAAPTPSSAPTPGEPTAAPTGPSAEPPLPTSPTAGGPSLALVLFDQDIVLVGGRNFTPSSTVTIEAAAGDLGGTAQTKAGQDGRFLIGFQVPGDFSGTISITAKEGGRSASGVLNVVGTNKPPAPAPPAPGPAPAPPAPAPAPAPGSIDTRGFNSGLPWMSGVHPSNELKPYVDFGTWRGRPIDVAVLFTIRDGGWGPLVEPSWPVNDFKSFNGKLIISQPMFPQGAGDNAQCAAGAYDEQWKKFGRYLVSAGRADSIVRIGWEFNGTFMYWHTDGDPKNFKECFKKVSAAIKSTDPKALIDWTINAHASPVPSSGNPWDAYPGDEYVDFVGIDSYDHYPPSKDEATWNSQCNDKNGLCYFIKFAREHGKKVGVGEWGVTSCSGNGGGDNPFYIQKMWDTFSAAKDVMGYESYYHDPMPGNVCSTIMNGGQNPKASALYKQLFGKAV
jgi:hypothetical protein